MSLNITPAGVAITKRFFLALDVLIGKRTIRGLKTFTDLYGINYWNFSTLRKEPTKRMLKSEWLMYLVSDFDIDAEWLLTGVGGMFKKHDEGKNET